MIESTYKPAAQRDPFGGLPNIARSLAMQELSDKLSTSVGEVAGVLITGEPGAGQEVVARAIHLATDDSKDTSGVHLLLRAMRQHSGHRPYTALDCSDRRELEERLFGNVLGAGSNEIETLERLSPSSKVSQANGGTLVLRHVTELPARLQVRLARLLRDGEANVLGDGGQVTVAPVAIRVLGTTEREADLVPELLRRLPVRIHVPPLRERREDIPALVRCLLADLSIGAGVAPKVASRQASELLSALPWRGNVSELEALLRTLVAHVPGRHIRLAHVLEYVRLDGRATVETYTGTLKEARECFERDYVAAVLERHRGRMAEAAKALGLQRTNLYRKVRQLAVTRGSGRRQLSER